MEEVKPAATGSENATQEQGYLMAYDKKEQKAKGVKGIAACAPSKSTFLSSAINCETNAPVSQTYLRSWSA